MNFKFVWWKSLKFRVPLFVLLLLLLSIGGQAAFNAAILQKEMGQLLGEKQYSTATLLAQGINEELKSRVEALERYAIGRITPALHANPPALQDRLENSPALLSLFNGGIFATDDKGIALASVPAATGRVGVSFMDRDSISRAINKGESSISRPVMGKKSNAPLFSIAVPLRGQDGQIIGALAGVTDLSHPNFLDRLLQGNYGKTGGFLLIDPRSQRFVTATDKTRIMQAVPAPGRNAMHDRYMQGYEGYGVATNSRGIHELSAAKRIPEADWFVVVTMPVEDAFAPINDMLNRIYSSSLLIGSLAGILVWWLIARMLQRRFEPMFEASQKLTSQEINSQSLPLLPVDREDEIGGLASSFNMLLSRLNQRNEYLSRERTVLRTLINTLPQLIWLKNTQEIYIGCNQRFETLLGVKEADLVGKTDEDLEKELTATGFKRGRPENEGENIPVTTEQEVIFVSDGHKELLETTTIPMRNEEGKLIGTLGISYDVSRRKAYEMELEQQQRHLEELVTLRTSELNSAKESAELANVAKTSFLANMSHEIRTPMNAIIGMANILRREGVTPPQALRLDKIDTASRHLLRLINDILDLSKIEAGKLQLESISMDLHQILENIQDLAQPLIGNRKLELIFESPRLTYRLRGDPTRLQQSLLNLVSNALKFTEEGHVRLKVDILRESTTHISLQFSISDTGIGIPPEKIDHLFSNFTQADNSITRNFGGTGLGLAITKRLVELMGGEIGISSTPGAGSTFRITLTLQKDTRSEQDHAIVTSPSVSGTRLIKDVTGARLLVAEDDPVNQEIIQSLLSDSGFDVDIADDGEQAVEMALKNNYALILMDMQMPVMGGIEATHQIRDSEIRQMPIIALTANAMLEDKELCLSAGMNDFLSKPFDPDKLNELILRWLNLGSSNVLASGKFHFALDHGLYVGNSIIDKEHEALFSCLEHLKQLPDNESGLSQFHEALANLGEMLLKHFTTEENMLDKLPLPQSEKEKHFSSHLRIVRQLSELQMSLLSNPKPDYIKVASKVEDWLKGHLLSFDLKMKPFILKAEETN